MINTFEAGENLSGLKREDFQKVIDGKQTDLFILKNENGAEAAVTNYGGAILTIMVPDKNGNYANVVQGHDSIDHVVNSPEPFLSTLIGRYGNRIAGGKFELDGKEYSLVINNGPNALHGGPTGYHARIWDAEQTSPQSVKLHYLSVDGEEGFPGNLDITVVYTFTNDNEFIIDYTATTDKKTVINMTNHSYFNLNGDPSVSSMNQVLYLAADSITPVDDTFMTSGEMMAVAGTPFDFNTPKAIETDVNNFDNEQIKFGKGFDHNWVLKTKGNINQVAAKLTSPTTGITLEVYTDEPGIQLYTGNFLDGTVKGKKGIVYPQRASVCLETQHYPDSPNKPHWPSVILEPGQTYTSHCIFKFGIVK